MGAFQQHVGDHQDDDVVFIGHAQLLHYFKEFPAAGHQVFGVVAGDLADGNVLLGNVELLVVCAQQFLRGLSVRTGGKQPLAQLLQRDVGNAGEAFGHGDVFLRAGGGFEHDRVGQNGRRHQPGHFG